MFGVGVVGLIASAVGYFFNQDQFFFSYLTSFVFFTSIGLASLILVMIHHITNSSWGTALRRLPETFSSNLWIWGIFVIPIILGAHNLYHWTHTEDVLADPILKGKMPYLNEPFFIARQVLYFAIWGFLGYRLHKKSVEMDETADWNIIRTFRRMSAPGILIFGLTVAFAGFDWLMSLDPHWFSTMFGVYFFAMSFQAIFPTLILLILWLRKNNILANTLTSGHIYDLGGWFFGFTVFYAYIAFSQFLLIYYANIPEETLWFYHRLEGSWSIVTFSLLIFRFIVPFVLLLNRDQKRRIPVLVAVSVLVLIMHFVELNWIAMPVMYKHGIHGSWMDITSFLGLGGIFFGLFFYRLGRHNIVPVHDPNLGKSLSKEFHN
jgi:hypothetical protein